jgi:hypothetical protein
LPGKKKARHGDAHEQSHYADDENQVQQRKPVRLANSHTIDLITSELQSSYRKRQNP